jgi:nitrate reductase (NAD(P)H)
MSLSLPFYSSAELPLPSVLQLQSVIAMPAHDEYISLVGKKGLDETYKIEGFAYTGGGQMVQKVEITLDGGQNWQYCFRKFSDSPIRHGNRVWSWCHW